MPRALTGGLAVSLPGRHRLGFTNGPTTEQETREAVQEQAALRVRRATSASSRSRESSESRMARGTGSLPEVA